MLEHVDDRCPYEARLAPLAPALWGHAAGIFPSEHVDARDKRARMTDSRPPKRCCCAPTWCSEALPLWLQSSRMRHSIAALMGSGAILCEVPGKQSGKEKAAN